MVSWLASNSKERSHCLHPISLKILSEQMAKPHFKVALSRFTRVTCLLAAPFCVESAGAARGFPQTY